MPSHDPVHLRLYAEIYPLGGVVTYAEELGGGWAEMGFAFASQASFEAAWYGCGAGYGDIGAYEKHKLLKAPKREYPNTFVLVYEADLTNEQLKELGFLLRGKRL